MPAASRVAHVVDHILPPLKSSPVVLPPGYDDVEFCFEQGWSDGLPVTPPTPSRVAAILAGTSRDPSHVLGKIPPNYNDITVEKVAIAAVMAGCRAEHFRVALAAVEAALDPTFNLHGIHATTMGVTPCVIVSGPVRLEAGLNFKHGALGSSGIQNRANASIGRCIKLAMQNVGGARLGGTESSTLGSPCKFTLCLAEWEELAEMWEPLHTLSECGGFLRDQSAVTLMAVAGGPTQIINFTENDANRLCKIFADSLKVAMSPAYGPITDLLLVVCPEHYRSFVQGGITSKRLLQEKLWELTADSGHSPGKFLKPSSIHIVVAGSLGGKFSAWMHCFGFGPAGAAGHMSRPVSYLVDPIPVKKLWADAPAESGVLLDPTAEVEVQEIPLVPRTGVIGPRIAFLDIAKPKGNFLLDALETKLCEDFPGLVVNRYSKLSPNNIASEELKQSILSDSNQQLVAALAD